MNYYLSAQEDWQKKKDSIFLRSLSQETRKVKMIVPDNKCATNAIFTTIGALEITKKCILSQPIMTQQSLLLQKPVIS